MDKLKEWQNKYPDQFNGLDEIISSFAEDEITKVCEFIYEYESIGPDPSTCYMLIPQNHTVSRIACTNLFEEIYNIKCQNKINDVLPKMESLVKSYWNESIPRHYYFELKLNGVKNKFEVEAYEPY